MLEPPGPPSLLCLRGNLAQRAFLQLSQRQTQVFKYPIPWLQRIRGVTQPSPLCPHFTTSSKSPLFTRRLAPRPPPALDTTNPVSVCGSGDAGRFGSVGSQSLWSLASDFLP